VFQSKALSIRKLLEARHSWIFDKAADSLTVNSIQLMKLLVSSGRYVAVTSELDAGPEIRSERLKFAPISDKDTFRQTISLASNKLIPESTATQKIIAMAVQLLERLTGPTDSEN
jgi:DNA-binding transcriptional LysR family regulator